MGWQIFRQPDGKYAIWSWIVDAFIWMNCSREKLIEIHVEDYKKQVTKRVNETTDALDKGEPRNHSLSETWASAVERMILVHGADHEYVGGLVKLGLIDKSRMRVFRMLARISNAGILELTMDDMRHGTDFDTATHRDIKYSLEPFHRASYVHLVWDGEMKIFKSRGERLPGFGCECGLTIEQYKERIAKLRAQEQGGEQGFDIG